MLNINEFPHLLSGFSETKNGNEVRGDYSFNFGYADTSISGAGRYFFTVTLAHYPFTSICSTSSIGLATHSTPFYNFILEGTNYFVFLHPL